MSANALDRFRPRRNSDRVVYTVQEVAELLGLALSGTYTLIREGTIPALKVGGRWLVPKRRFHAWLDGLDDQDDDVPDRPDPVAPTQVGYLDDFRERRRR
jgi:excisionase family DNA binding protein